MLPRRINIFMLSMSRLVSSPTPSPSPGAVPNRKLNFLRTAGRLRSNVIFEFFQSVRDVIFQKWFPLRFQHELISCLKYIFWQDENYFFFPFLFFFFFLLFLGEVPNESPCGLACGGWGVNEIEIQCWAGYSFRVTCRDFPFLLLPLLLLLLLILLIIIIITIKVLWFHVTPIPPSCLVAFQVSSTKALTAPP